MNTTEEPKTYLSNTNGMWRVIWKGIPLNSDTPDRARAEAVAKKFNVELPSLIWNGEGWIKDNQ